MMAVIRGADEIVKRTPGVVLSLDKDLRVLGWSREAQEALALTATKIRGRRCYELVSATDAETGRACVESCPLAHGSSRPGRAFRRDREPDRLKTRAVRVDCLQPISLLSLQMQRLFRPSHCHEPPSLHFRVAHHLTIGDVIKPFSQSGH